MKRTIQLATFAIFALIFCMGATCNKNNSKDNLLAAHSTVREAFIMMDAYVASQYEEAGDTCIEKVLLMELDSKDEKMDAWKECMKHWSNIHDALKYSHEIFVEMELVYESIEEGRDRYKRWKFWASSLLNHAQNILASLKYLEIDVPDYYRTAVDILCNAIDCNEVQDG
jgi:hypothetical protein